MFCFSLCYSVSGIIGLLKPEATFSKDFYFWFIECCYTQVNQLGSQAISVMENVTNYGVIQCNKETGIGRKLDQKEITKR